jgi:hypothetical protein
MDRSLHHAAPLQAVCRLALFASMLVGMISTSPRRADALDRSEFDRIQPVVYFNPQTWERRPFYPIGWYQPVTLNCSNYVCPDGNPDLSTCDCAQESLAICRRCGDSPTGPFSQSLREIAATGANTILVAPVGIDWNNYEYLWRLRYTLDAASAFGLKVVVQFSPRLLQSDASAHPRSCFEATPQKTCLSSTESPGVAPSCAANRAALTDWVLALRDHPALLAWELGDEETAWAARPEQVPEHCDTLTDTEMQNAAAYLHELDPNRQLWQVISDESNDQQTANYMVGTDVFSHDPYYFLRNYSRDWAIASTNSIYQQDADWSSRSYGFSPWGYAGNVDILQGWAGYIEGCSELNRFPDAIELRWSTFAGIASGAKRGALAWRYEPEVYCQGTANAYQAPCDSYQDQGHAELTAQALLHASCSQWASFRDVALTPVFRELRRLEHALATGWNAGVVNVAPNGIAPNPGPENGIDHYRPYQQISSILLYDDIARRYFLVLTNNTGSARAVAAQVPTGSLPASLASQQAAVLSSSDLVWFYAQPPTNILTMSDTLPAYGVRIYELVAGAPAVKNGAISGTAGWTSTGPAQASAFSRSSDSSGSLQLWTTGGQYWMPGATRGRWTQSFPIDPGTTNVVRFYARTGGWHGWYTAQIQDPMGNVLASADDVNVYGTWQMLDLRFHSGTSRAATIVLTNASLDWVLFDDFALRPSSVNGSIDTTRGWSSTGGNLYWSTMTRSNDGSGSLEVWAGAEGPGSGKWTQCAAVVPHKPYLWRFFNRAGGNERYFRYRITSESGGVIVQSGDRWAGKVPQDPTVPAGVASGTQWREEPIAFDPGGSSIACLEVSALSYDWVRFDDFLLLPRTLEDGEVRTATTWTAGGRNAGLDPSTTRTADGSSSLRLWAGGYAPTRYAGLRGWATGTWSQCVGVPPNQFLTWSFWAKGLMNDMYFHYRVRDTFGNAIIDRSALDQAIRVDGSWQQYTVRFSTGNASAICLDLGARSWDYVMFDDLALAP